MTINNINYSQALSPYYVIGFDTFTSTNIADRTWALDTRFHRTLTSSKAHKKKVWKKKVYPLKDSRNGNNPLSLPSQTTNR